MSDIRLWTPPVITVGHLNAWIKANHVTHRQLAAAIGMKAPGIRNILYSGNDRELPPRICCALAATAIFSGMSGLFDEVKLVDMNVALHLARGMKAAQLPKRDRSLADCHALGYASRLADRLLNTATSKATTNVKIRGDDPGGKESQDAAPQASTGS